MCFPKPASMSPSGFIKTFQDVKVGSISIQCICVLPVFYYWYRLFTCNRKEIRTVTYLVHWKHQWNCYRFRNLVHFLHWRKLSSHFYLFILFFRRSNKHLPHTVGISWAMRAQKNTFNRVSQIDRRSPNTSLWNWSAKGQGGEGHPPNLQLLHRQKFSLQIPVYKGKKGVTTL